MVWIKVIFFFKKAQIYFYKESRNKEGADYSG